MKIIKSSKSKTFIVFLIMIVVFYLIIKDDYMNIIETLQKANHWLILLAVILIFVYYYLKAKCIYVIAKEQNKNITFKSMFNQTLITQFFNGITPFSTGGQPMQVYMLRKNGLPVGQATSIIIQDFLMFQLALVTIGIVALVLNRIFGIINISIALYSLIILGFAINTAVGLCLIFISFSKRFNTFAGKLLIRIASKFKIVKDKEKTIEKLEEKLEEFHESAKIFKKRRGLFTRCYLYNLFALFIFYAIPLVIFISLDPNCGLTVAQSITSSAFVLLVGNFVPIPGGSGGIEFSFSTIFGGLLNNTTLVSTALLTWRVITYYLGVLIGGIALTFFKGSEKK